MINSWQVRTSKSGGFWFPVAGSKQIYIIARRQLCKHAHLGTVKIINVSGFLKIMYCLEFGIE